MICAHLDTFGQARYGGTSEFGALLQEAVDLGEHSLCLAGHDGCGLRDSCAHACGRGHGLLQLKLHSGCRVTALALSRRAKPPATAKCRKACTVWGSVGLKVKAF